MTGCLGTGEYVARFVQRATITSGPRAVGEITASAGDWRRRLSEVTDASVTVAVGSDRDLLRRIVPWRHELEIIRDGDLCWAGPVVDVMSNPGEGTMTFPARDLSAWWWHRVILDDLVYRGADLAEVFASLLAYAEAVAPIGLTVETRTSGITGDRTYAAIDARYVGDELTELSQTGCDWTVTGRQAWVGGQEIAPGRRLPSPLLDEAFKMPPPTRLSGEMVTEPIVRGSQVLGRAGGPDPDGLVIQRVLDSSAIEDQGSADAAAQTWLDRAHDPLAYVDGEASLAPSAPVTMAELIPGLVVRVDLDGQGVLPVAADLRLESLTVTFDGDGEDPVIALQPLGTVETDG